tara:strand:- start:483 stop:956 length:474 start_codon:yes stop_codon:yes gene_type:complete
MLGNYGLYNPSRDGASFLPLLMRWFCFICASIFLLTGCTTSTITNLTPRVLPHNQAGLYTVEAMFQSNQRSLDKTTMKPMVIYNNQAFPMRKTELAKGRWETLVPIPGGTKVINYHFKFDYQYNAVLMRGTDSKLSPPYQLQIVDESAIGNLLMSRD